MIFFAALLGLLCTLGALETLALVAQSLNYKLAADVVASGGGGGSGEGIHLSQSTIGQPVAYGTDLGASYQLEGGFVLFWSGLEIAEGEGELEGEEIPEFHSADVNTDNKFTLSELLRIVQLYNAGGYQCADPLDFESEDGFLVGFNPGAQACGRHGSDYSPRDWRISLSELLRAVQFYNLGGYVRCDQGTEDGYCPVTN